MGTETLIHKVDRKIPTEINLNEEYGQDGQAAGVDTARRPVRFFIL